MNETANDQVVLALLQPVLEQVEPVAMPALVAALERAAANHYERWAKECADADARQSLLTGRDYEIDNAAVLERLFPGVAEQQQTLLERFPELPQTFDRAFANLSLAEQLRAQAAAEAVGADLYRGFADDYPDAAGQAELLHCAELEQVNADLLLDAAARL